MLIVQALGEYVRARYNDGNWGAEAAVLVIAGFVVWKLISGFR